VSQFELLDRRERTRRVARTTLTCLAIIALTLTAYIMSPGRLTSSAEVVVRLIGELVLIAAAIVLAVRSIWRSDFPIMRAIETLTAVVSVLIVGFASVYLLASGNDPTAFNEPLDHTGALYFSLTTATTVGFGDINPTSNPARVVVMVQMITNVVVLGIVARLLISTARRRANVT
jgi:hypothetical protein